MNCSILVRKSFLVEKLPRRRSFRTRMENQISIWLSHDACLGVKWKLMRWSGWRRKASRVALDASTPDLALTPSLPLRPQWRAGNQANDGLGEVDVEIVADDIPAGIGGNAAQQAAEKPCEVILRPGIADHAFDCAGGDVEGGDQGLSAMTAVLELTPFDLARHHRQPGGDALQGLNAGHLVDGDRATGVIGGSRSLVNRADVGALGVEGGIGLRGQPLTDAMRFEVGLFFKKRPTERCEMLGTRPRRIASSAISRWLQWLIGRSLSDGFSQVMAITAQICSGVYVP